VWQVRLRTAISVLLYFTLMCVLMGLFTLESGSLTPVNDTSSVEISSVLRAFDMHHVYLMEGNLLTLLINCLVQRR